MAKNKAQNFYDDKSEGNVDTHEANFQCAINKDEHLGFAIGGGVTFQEFTSEQGRLTWNGVCG